MEQDAKDKGYEMILLWSVHAMVWLTKLKDKSNVKEWDFFKSKISHDRSPYAKNNFIIHRAIFEDYQFFKLKLYQSENSIL